MDVVITYDHETKEYKFYEPTSDTLLISNNLGEGFANLNLFLMQFKKNTGSILNVSDINYHIDSHCFIQMIESNISLMRRLQGGQSEFKTSADKFGGSTQSAFGKQGSDSFGKSFGNSKFGGSKSKFGKSDKKWKS